MPRNIITDEEIARIKALYASGVTCAEIARQLGRTKGRISELLNGKRTKHKAIVLQLKSEKNATA